MKALFVKAALVMVCIPAFGQGTVNFANSGPGYLATVFDTDGVTPLQPGSAWLADLFWAPGRIASSAALTALDLPTTFSTVPAQAGLFFGGPRTIPGTVPGEEITAQVRVWDSASGNFWGQASRVNGARIGESIIFGVVLGGATPAEMSGLNAPWSVVSIPEPSAIALAGLGSAAMLVLRRQFCKKQASLTNHGSQRRLSLVGHALCQRPGVAAFTVKHCDSQIRLWHKLPPIC